MRKKVGNTSMPAPTKFPNRPLDPMPMRSNGAPTDAASAALAVFKPVAARTITAGEDPDEFNALVRAVTEYLQPRDLFEQLLTLDIINAEWELRRIRRLTSAAFIADRPY